MSEMLAEVILTEAELKELYADTERDAMRRTLESSGLLIERSKRIQLHKTVGSIGDLFVAASFGDILCRIYPAVGMINLSVIELHKQYINLFAITTNCIIKGFLGDSFGISYLHSCIKMVV
jgi:hypothetical protein